MTSWTDAGPVSARIVEQTFVSMRAPSMRAQERNRLYALVERTATERNAPVQCANCGQAITRRGTVWEADDGRTACTERDGGAIWHSPLDFDFR